MISWYIFLKIGSLALENLQNSLKLVAILNEKKFDVQQLMKCSENQLVVF